MTSSRFVIEIRGEPAAFLQSPAEDSRFVVRLTPILGVAWLWRASFSGYGADERDWGFSLTRARAEAAEAQAIAAMRHGVVD